MTSLAAVVTLTSAVTVGIISFVGARLGSRETFKTALQKNKFEGDLKIAQYRIDWTDSLRTILTEIDKLAVECLFNKNFLKHTEFLQYQSSITFRMNPKDPNFNGIRDAIYDMASASTQTELVRAQIRFQELAQPVLKREWDKAKDEIRRAGQDNRRDTEKSYVFPHGR